MAVVDKITDFVLFIGKLMVVGAVGKICHKYILWKNEYIDIEKKVHVQIMQIIAMWKLLPQLHFEYYRDCDREIQSLTSDTDLAVPIGPAIDHVIAFPVF